MVLLIATESLQSDLDYLSLKCNVLGNLNVTRESQVRFIHNILRRSIRGSKKHGNFLKFPAHEWVISKCVGHNFELKHDSTLK